MVLTKNMINSDLQPIILAAGKGTRMPQILSGQPKCLLGVGNKPMIQYPLEMLIKAHFKSASMFVLKNEENAIRSAVNKLALPIEIEYISMDDSDCATAENFVNTSKTFSKHLLVISCDTVTDYDLKEFIRFYREKNATMLALFSSIDSSKEDLAPARKLAPNAEYDFVGFSKSQANHLVFFEPDSKFDDEVLFKRSFLRQVPSFDIFTNRQDAHVYIVKNWLFNYLKEKKTITSIKGDLIPSLVRKQFRKWRAPEPKDPNHDAIKKEEGTEHIFFNCYQQDPVDFQVDKILNAGLEEIKDDLGPVPNPIRCYGLVADSKNSGFCLRTNNLQRFCEANRIMLKDPKKTRNSKTEKLKSHVDGFVGADTCVGEKCSIKKTVIGAGCKIGESVTLQNCILLDKIQIADGVTLKNCLVGPGAVIEKDSEIQDCIVGAKEVIAEGSNHKNEMIVVMNVAYE